MDQRQHHAASGHLLQLSNRLRPALIAFSNRRLRDASLAKDLTQDLFCRLASGPQHVVDNPEAYIFRIAANLVNDHYRRESVRTRYQHGECADGRIALLEEILRLEPVIGSLRRLVDGEVVEIDLRSANVDEHAVGACPFSIDAERERAAKVGGPALSFGNGEHRCPGAGVAIHEAAVLLDRLLRLPGIRLDAPPRMAWNPLALRYELRGCRVGVDT